VLAFEGKRLCNQKIASVLSVSTSMHEAHLDRRDVLSSEDAVRMDEQAGAKLHLLTLMED
jgi:hypothetical protein